MIKAIIIDDEQHCIDRVEALLKPYSNTITIIGSYLTVDAGIRGIESLTPDVVFLDVQIHEQTGFDVLKAVKQLNFEVIFTTAFEMYAVQAFKFSAIDYLLKPIDADDFKLAIDKLSQKIEAKDFSKKVKVLLDNISKHDVQKKITIPTLEGLEFLEVANIIRCEADVNYTIIHTKDGRKIMVAKTLKSFEALLTDCNFFRVHNSHLINLNHLVKYTKGKGGYVTLIDHSTIEVSVRRKDDFLKAIG
jgi:two-component system LytT family response regulator